MASACPARGGRYSARPAASSRTAGPTIDHDRNPLRRSRHRQCHCRRDRPRRGGFFARARHAQGRHGADRRGRARRRSTTPWVRRWKSPAARRRTPSSALASLGARAAFIGKIKDDELGRAFSHDIRAAGVSFTTRPAADGPSTGRCYVLVTPDGERTMNTFLGAAQDLHPPISTPTRLPQAPSSISKAICGTRRTPRRRFSRRPRSRTRPAARWR